MLTHVFHEADVIDTDSQFSPYVRSEGGPLDQDPYDAFFSDCQMDFSEVAGGERPSSFGSRTTGSRGSTPKSISSPTSEYRQDGSTSSLGLGKSNMMNGLSRNPAEVYSLFAQLHAAATRDARQSSNKGLSIPSISGTSPRTLSPSPGSSSADLARGRATNSRLALAEERTMDYQRSVTKQAQAGERRELMRQVSSKVLINMWRAIIAVVGFAKSLKDPRRSRRRSAQTDDAARRFERNLRLKQLASMPRPTLLELKADKLLALYPDHRLRSFIAQMVPKYYFAGETVTRQNCVEDEMLVLCKGSVEVVVSGMVMSILSTPGTVIGAMGMISCEPRTASVVAKTNCVLWSGNGFGFDVVNSQTTIAAAQLIAEQRHANFRQVHQAMLAPTSLKRYPLMSGISNDGLRIILECGEPLIAKKRGVTILAPTDTLASTALFLLSGKATLVLRRSHFQSEEKIAEALAWAADFPRGQKNFIFTARPKPVRPLMTMAGRPHPPASPPQLAIAHLLRYIKLQAERGLPASAEDANCDGGDYCCWQDDNDNDDDEQETIKGSDDSEDDDCAEDDSLVPIGELVAPCLINFAPMAMRKWVGIGVVTKSLGVEALVLRRGQLFDALPVADVLRLSENALKSTFKLIRAPAPDKLPKLFCEAQRFASALHSLQLLHFELLQTSPFAFPEGSLLEFTSKGKDPQRCYIVTKGELGLEGRSATNQHAVPFLWPPLPILFYGTDDKLVRCRTQVEGVSFRRSAFLQLLNHDIKEIDRRKTFVSSMEEHYFAMTMRPPTTVADNNHILESSWIGLRRGIYGSSAALANQKKESAREGTGKGALEQGEQPMVVEDEDSTPQDSVADLACSFGGRSRSEETPQQWWGEEESRESLRIPWHAKYEGYSEHSPPSMSPSSARSETLSSMRNVSFSPSPPMGVSCPASPRRMQLAPSSARPVVVSRGPLPAHSSPSANPCRRAAKQSALHSVRSSASNVDVELSRVFGVNAVDPSSIFDLAPHVFTSPRVCGKQSLRSAHQPKPEVARHEQHLPALHQCSRQQDRSRRERRPNVTPRNK